MATLNDDELQALMSAIQEGQVATPAAAVRPESSAVAYDITNRDKLVRGEMPTLDAIHDRAANIFGSGLAGHTRLDVRATGAAAVLVRFADLHPSFSPPSTVCILTLGLGGEQGLVIFEEGFADTLLAAALGDRKAKPTERAADAPRRSLTTVDRGVLKKLVTLLCEALTDCWRDLLPTMQPAVLRFEEDPRLCMVAAPNDLAVTVPIEVIGQLAGRMRVAFPYSFVEPVRRQLSSAPRAPSGNDGRFGRHVATELEQVKVSLAAVLGRASVRLEKLLALEAGDVLVLEANESDPVPVLVEGNLKFLAEPLTTGRSIAVRIREASPPATDATPA